MRDDFSMATKETLAKRVAHHCSNPQCRQVTSGPQDDPEKAINIGVAAHITAASEDGPRYNPSLTPMERRSTRNGVWLCQNCAKLVDNDVVRYDVEILRLWKRLAEKTAIKELENGSTFDNEVQLMFARIERLMPELLVEMRNDLENSPFVREFFLFNRNWVYSGGSSPSFTYYYDDHADLDGKIHILENYGLIRNLSHNSRYRMTERFAIYLGAE
jgi:hypothetical protein